jgi:hypothetical protein
MDFSLSVKAILSAGKLFSTEGKDVWPSPPPPQPIKKKLRKTAVKREREREREKTLSLEQAKVLKLVIETVAILNPFDLKFIHESEFRVLYQKNNIKILF